jgi:hypothetical protein
MVLISGCAAHYDLTESMSKKDIADLWESKDSRGVTWWRLWEDGRADLKMQVGGTTINMEDASRWSLDGTTLYIVPVVPSSSRGSMSYRILSLSDKGLVLENTESKKIEKYTRK